MWLFAVVCNIMWFYSALCVLYVVSCGVGKLCFLLLYAVFCGSFVHVVLYSFMWSHIHVCGIMWLYIVACCLMRVSCGSGDSGFV